MNQGKILFLMFSDICVANLGGSEAPPFLLCLFYIDDQQTTTMPERRMHQVQEARWENSLYSSLKPGKRIKGSECRPVRLSSTALWSIKQAEGSHTLCRGLARFSSIYQGNPWGHKSLSCPAGWAHIPLADSVSNLPALGLCNLDTLEQPVWGERCHPSVWGWEWAFQAPHSKVSSSGNQ